MMMHVDDVASRSPQLDFETWRTSLQSVCGRYSPEGAAPDGFVGWVRPTSIFGFDAVDLACNAEKVDRDHRDVRLDGREHYFAVFQIGGRSTMLQNGYATELAPGMVMLIDSTRPMTCYGGGQAGRWLSLHLPRDELALQFGKQPEGGLRSATGKIAARLLSQLVRDALRGIDDSARVGDPHMKLAVYDLMGALFAPRDDDITSYSHSNFTRVCRIIRDRYSDPELSPGDVAREAGMSIRYMQKLFSAHGTTCTRFMQSARLNHAERLISRRSALHSGQPISEIAYQSGFGDYNHFRRLFRERFGSSPIEHRGQS
ncbi:helix-turn-helix domain-containing protein [Inquilinus sp.]|jgi:AraC family transcriptional activator of tynA and feaB|uniref:helix-turn-helix domain-containing protein n=1 Tax=Inquilinus sp. TaxID=1932117 RepID=UPI00378429E5